MGGHRFADDKDNKPKNRYESYTREVNNNEQITNERIEKKQKKRKKKKGLKILIIILIIIIIILGALFGFIFSKLGKMKYEKINTENLSINADMNDFRNIAILGIDSRNDSYGTDYRTDCIMIASINKKTNDIKLYSIYRDTYVRMTLDGKIVLNKINQAYYGGVENTIKTINENLDLNIKEYILADFDAVANFVDAVDGVEISITTEEAKYINDGIKEIKKVSGKYASEIQSSGKQKLNGMQAVAYSRIRNTEGADYKRTERMRTVLEKAINKLKKLNTYEMNSVISELLPKIRTNLSSFDILGLVPTLLNANLQASFGWPYVTEGVWLDGDFYGPANTHESNVVKLHQEVYNQPSYETSSTVKEISQEIIEKTGVGK